MGRIPGFKGFESYHDHDKWIAPRKGRQTPEVVIVTETSGGHLYNTCPVCGRRLQSQIRRYNHINYCPRCGQRLVWTGGPYV